MAAVWIRLGAELRRRWRPLLAIALLAGVSAGAVITTAIAADRTGTVMDRLVASLHSPDIFYPPDFQETKVPLDKIAALPMVESVDVLRAFGVFTPRYQDLEAYASTTQPFSPDEGNLLDGRLPVAREEVAITFKVQERYGWHVGEVVPLTFVGPGPQDDGSDPVAGPTVRVRITAVVSTPGDFVGVAGPIMILTPELGRELTPQSSFFELYTIFLRRGAQDLIPFERAMQGLTGGGGILYAELPSGVEQAKRGFLVQSAALWVLCGALALVVSFVVAQTIARQSTLESSDHATLRALGMRRRHLVLVGIVRAGIAAAGAAVVATATAAGVSAITPFGRARLAEPDRGVSLPAVIVGIGLLALIVVVIGSATVVGWRAASARERLEPSVRRSRFASVVHRMLRRPSPSIGARLALEPGRGTTAVPVRSALAASVIAIVALLAALTIGASIDRLLTDQTLYGWTWDANVSGEFAPGSDDLEALTTDPAVDAVSVGYGGGEGAVFRVNGVATGGFTADPVKGSILPRLIAGRAPHGRDEIVLGPKMLRRVGAAIGDAVELSVQGLPATVNLHVVGVAVMPFDDDVATVGEGMWTTVAVLRRIAGDMLPEAGDTALVRFKPGVDIGAARDRLADRFEQVEAPFKPKHVQEFGQVSSLTAIVAGTLAVLAAGTLTHMLVTSIGRRRRDLAILKALGFSRGQVRTTIGWQAAVFVIVALAIAIPLGTIAGRWAWSLIADYEGFAVARVVPPLSFALVAATSLVASLAIASIPARSAGRTQPALVLRAE